MIPCRLNCLFHSHFRRCFDVGKVPDRAILERTVALLQEGASGIVYGRNIIQHHKPAAIIKALMGVVHDKLSVDQALAMVKK